MVGLLRLWAYLYPDDTQLASLVGELSMKSAEFRTLWAAHDVKQQTHGPMWLTHPLVGELTLRYETLALQGDEDQYPSTSHAAPGSPSEEGDPGAAARQLGCRRGPERLHRRILLRSAERP